MKFRCHKQHESVPFAVRVNDPEFEISMQARATIGSRSSNHGSNKVQAFRHLGGAGRDA